MKDNKNKKRIFRKIVLSCFVFCIVSFGFLEYVNIEVVKAQFWSREVTDAKTDEAIQSGAKVMTYDPKTGKWVRGTTWQEKVSWLWEKGWNEKILPALKKAGSKAYYSALSKALNTIAYDTATWIGSGGKGQSPMFIREGWGEYITNIGDNAAGNFIETLGREGFGGEKFNLCEPDFAVKTKIGLGLLYKERPKAPECTFSKMKENWDEALRSDDFLTDFQDMFEPESNDLGMALTLQSGIIEDKRISEKMGELERIANKGWLNLRGIDGLKKNYPGFPEKQAERAEYLKWSNLSQYTGDAFIDAINIFLNQLSITAFQNLMKNIGKGKDTSTYPYDWDNLADFEAGPFNSGIAGAKNKFRELLEPKFNIRGDYDILSELTMCPDPNKAGPTNCVIEDKFRQAIENKVTVGDAIKQGYLNAEGIFGFNSDGLEPSYKDINYPYRSMIILRKFRILPVGWEVAAQYIKDNPNKIDGIKNLGDLVACYDDSDEYEGYYSSWCKGLVDPNWVLKAPLNYCKREGYGPEIVSEQISGEGYDSELSISRNENYCADEQSCIKENSDGSCEMYGYCTEEKRKWNFNADSCDPNYNTCQTFRNRDGKTVSYLENTLDYGICNIDNVGCQEYSISSTGYNSDTDTVNWDGTNNMYFDKDIEECDVDSEGCHEFIRTKAGLGANLLINSSFENGLDMWTPLPFNASCEIMEDSSESYIGDKSLKIVHDGTSPGLSAVSQRIYGIIPNETITVSYYIKTDLSFGGHRGPWLVAYCLDSADNHLLDPSTGNGWVENSVIKDYYNGDGIWKRIEFSFVTFDDTVSLKIEPRIQNSDGTAYFDAIKVERGEEATVYSDYRQNGLVYEKLLPDYLEDSCYENPGVNYQFKDDMPDICNNFARKCNQNEAGCSMYTSVDDNIGIPAKVLAQDYCPAECDGYDNYLQQESVFDSLNPAYFIPKTAQTCGAESIGCDEFTNLDKIEEQGEQIEYYSYLRQCRNPDNQCADFYTWEGSSETGYQLRSFNLQGNGNEPAVTEDDSLECNEIIYNLPATDPIYNSDCREFYNTTGNISYHLYKRTISCSDNCHPYRRTRNNVVKNLDNSNLSLAQCNSLPGVGDKQIFEGQCIFCKNGGVWNEQHQSCIYMAIPNEGIQCSASADGCREYSGNSGNNIRIILNNDFEGSTQNWEGDSLAELSNNSLMVGGESLQISGGNHLVSTTIGYLAEQNKSYYLTFIAKGDGASSFTNIGFNNGVSIEYFIENPDVSMSVSGNWKIYKFNLASLKHEVNDTESLFIQADGDFFIDNIRLTEITDRYYLIKDSWNTPDSCYEDIYGNPAGETHNLGCSAYSDKDDKTHYLRQFSNLCQESSVGCELMIDTHNYNNYDSSSWNGPGDDLVEVNIDNYIYAVYDQEKECNNNDQGCTRFGKVYEYENNFVYGDIYLKNNPNKYDEILCEEEAVDCDEWVSDEGTNYFKNPKDQICEWRQLSGEGEKSWNWFKKKMKYCDSDSDGIVTSSDNNLCLSNNDCDLIGLTCQKSEECGVNNVCVDGQCHYSCILDNNDYDCPVSNLKTFGYGGNGNIVYQPTQDLNGYWTGICSADQSGCSEYIDPISKFNTNIIFNADFSQNVDNDLIADGWNGSSQNILLKPQTLYTVSVNGDNDITISVNSNILRELNNNNSLGSLTNNISISSGNQRVSKIFYVVDDNEVSATINVNNSFAGNNSSVELKKAIVEYQKKQEVDKETCNGIVNFDDGCVLFNERVQNGLSLSNSIWDADLTFNDGTGVSPNVGIESERDANTLIKVTPDRICNSWLACRSYIKDEDNNNICFDVGLCDSFDANGNCGNFVLSKKENQTYPTSAKISNMSGYAKAGYNNGSLNSDYYPLGAMKQIGGVTQVPNGSFEFSGSDGYPIGWRDSKGKWNENKFKVIDNPIEAEVEGVNYAPDGRSFLKLGSIFHITSEFIDVEPNTQYILSSFINTINLSFGVARIIVEEYDDDANLIDTKDDVVYMESGFDWTNKLGYFTTNSDTERIKLLLTGNEPVDINVTQNGVTTVVPALFSTNQTAEDFYDYRNSSFGNNNFFDLMAGERSNLFIHHNINDNIVSVAFLHDCANKRVKKEKCRDKDGGRIIFTFSDISAGNKIAVRDDPKNENDPITYSQTDSFLSIGDSLSSGDIWNWRYTKENTDGGMIEMPKSDWSITIDPDFRKGINKWVFNYVGGIINLDTDAPVTLTYHYNEMPTGNFYFDDIKIRSVLKTKEISGEDYLYTPQTCRLYPENDSLSCEYYEDSGKRQKGWLGYCLEYDRYPGNKDACLLWYPIDKVKGEGVEEGAGYKGRVPVYYTINANRYVNVPAYDSAGSAAPDADGVVNLFWTKQTGHGDLSGSFSYNYSKLVVPGGNYEIRNKQGRGSINFDKNDINSIEINIIDKIRNESEYSFELWDNDLNERVFIWAGNVDGTLSIVFVPIKQYASKIVQVVTSVGQNKYWSGRVYEGSDYSFSCNIGIINPYTTTCNYLTDYYPFGSLVSPAKTLSELSNPYEWDSKDKDGIQPLYYEEPNLSLNQPYQARMGQLHSKNNIKRIFAQSYGSWSWNGERYVPISGQDWSVPDEICEGSEGKNTMFSVSQGGNTWILPNTFSSPLDPASFYNYHDGAWPDFAERNQSNSENLKAYMEGDRSIIFVYYDESANEYSVGFIHDCSTTFDSNCTDSAADITDATQEGVLNLVEFTFDSVTPGNTIVVADDSPLPKPMGVGETINDCIGTEAECFNNSKNVSESLTSGDHWWWKFNKVRTDGGMIQMPADNWSMTITPNFINGFNRWAVIDGDGQETLLDMNQPVTISKISANRDIEYCANPPQVSNIKVNNILGVNINLNKNGFINLTFNSKVDFQQLPLVMYAIDWGDNEKIVVSGVEMRDRSNVDNPHSVYHLYSYWDLKAKHSVDQENNSVYCGNVESVPQNYNDESAIGVSCPDNSNCCVIKPSVKIKDNWGWCNNGENGDACPVGGYEPFNNWIIVTEY